MKIGKRFSVRGRVARCEIGASPNARLEIGKRVFVNQGASIVAKHSIEMGGDSQIGDFVAVYDSDYHCVDPYHPMQFASVVIGANVWLCRGVMVVPGSTVGDHSRGSGINRPRRSSSARVSGWEPRASSARTRYPNRVAPMLTMLGAHSHFPPRLCQDRARGR